MPFNYSFDDDSVLSNSSLCFGSIIKSLQIISNVPVRSYRVNQNEFFQFAIFEWKVDSILFATDSASTQISLIQFIFSWFWSSLTSDGFQTSHSIRWKSFHICSVSLFWLPVVLKVFLTEWRPFWFHFRLRKFASFALYEL